MLKTVDKTLEGLLRSMSTSGFLRTLIHFDSLNPEKFYIIHCGIFILLSALTMVLVVNSTSSFAAGLLCTVASFTCATSGSVWVVMGPTSSPVFTLTFLVFKGYDVIKTIPRLFVVIF